jgi:nitrogen fixation protein FixH
MKWIIAVVLGGTVLANGVMIAIAQRAAPTLEARDAYTQTLDWQHTLEARRAAEALGWRAEVRVCPEGRDDGACAVEYVLRDAAGRPVEGLRGRLDARRADSAGFDAGAELEPRGDGRYVARLPLGAGGAWRLDATLAGGPAPWFDQRRVSVKP